MVLSAEISAQLEIAAASGVNRALRAAFASNDELLALQKTNADFVNGVQVVREYEPWIRQERLLASTQTVAAGAFWADIFTLEEGEAMHIQQLMCRFLLGGATIAGEAQIALIYTQGSTQAIDEVVFLPNFDMPTAIGESVSMLDREFDLYGPTSLSPTSKEVLGGAGSIDFQFMAVGYDIPPKFGPRKIMESNL